jgi:hypothetical protein
MKKRGFDPLACIPSVDAIRRRLESIETERHNFGILLRVAKRLKRDHRTDIGGTPSKGVVHGQ